MPQIIFDTTGIGSKNKDLMYLTDFEQQLRKILDENYKTDNYLIFERVNKD